MNFETFQHEKVNNRFEFPLRIDLEPYTKEGLARLEAEKRRQTDPSVEVPPPYSEHPPEYYRYALYGILVHTGSAQSGHYYSFIRNRRSRSPTEAGAWLEYNDREIRPFDISKELEEQCFGGESAAAVSSVSSSWGVDAGGSERIKSAYMLCYEREGIYAGNCTDEPQIEASLFPALAHGVPPTLSSEPLSRVLPPRIQASVLYDNARFMEGRFVFNSDYYSFIKQLLCAAKELMPKQKEGQQEVSESSEAVKDASNSVVPSSAADASCVSLEFVQFCTRSLLETLLRSADSRVVSEYTSALSELYAMHDDACAWFVEHLTSGGLSDEQRSLLPPEQRKTPSSQLIVDLFLTTREAAVRQAALSLLLVCFRRLLPGEQAAGLWPPHQVHGWQDRAAQSRLQRYFLAHHSHLLDAAPRNWVRFHEYLLFYLRFLELAGVAGRRFMLAHGVAAALADLFLQDASPLVGKNAKKKRETMGNVVTQPSFGPLLQTLAMLARTCYLPRKLPQLPAAQQSAAAQPGANAAPAASDEGQQQPAEQQAEVLLPLPPTLLPDALLPLEESAESSESVPSARAQPFSPLDYQMLTVKELHSRAFSTGESSDTLVPFSVHMAYENVALSMDLVALVLQGLVQQSDSSGGKPFLDLMAALVAIEDSVSDTRHERLLAPNSGVLHSLHVYRDHSARVTYGSIKFLVRIMRDTPAFARKMFAVRDSWRWCDLWLKTYADKKPVITSAAAAAVSGQAAQANAQRIAEARHKALKQYEELLQQYGEKLCLDPPPPPALPPPSSSSASSSSSSSGARVTSIEEEGSDGDRKPLLAAGVRLNPDYIPRVGQQGGSKSDDEFDDAASSTSRVTVSPSSSSRRRPRRALSIGVPGGASEVADGGDDSQEDDPTEADDVERGPGLVDADEEDDEKSSSYKQRSVQSNSQESEQLNDTAK